MLVRDWLHADFRSHSAFVILLQYVILTITHQKIVQYCHIPTLASDLSYSLISQTSKQTVLFWITLVTLRFHSLV